MHSGDSACAIPPPTLPGDVVATIEEHTRRLAEALSVVGLLNVQYAVKDGVVHVLEANPRASRTVPFVSKAIAVPLAKIAARVMVGATLAEFRTEGLLPPGDPRSRGGHVAVKEAALPFDRFGVDTLLGPEMRSTGEVMGIDRTFGLAFAKSQMAVGTASPTGGRCSCRWPTATSLPGSSPPAASPTSASPWWPPRARPPPVRPRASRWPRWWPSTVRNPGKGVSRRRRRRRCGPHRLGRRSTWW